MKIDYILKTLAVVCLTIESVSGGPINGSVNSTKAPPPKQLSNSVSSVKSSKVPPKKLTSVKSSKVPPKKLTSVKSSKAPPKKLTSVKSSKALPRATSSKVLPKKISSTRTVSKATPTPTTEEIFNYILKVPLFNSTESNSSDSDSYLTLNWVHNKNLNKYGYGISTMDERFEACRDKFAMRDIYYKTYCGSDCQYTPKFDLGTCNLVCEKFKNNSECLNDPMKYYYNLGIKDIYQVYTTIYTKKIMVIDSNESAVPSGESYVTIDQLISGKEVTYFNVESNDDRVSSCSENKNLKEIFKKNFDYSNYCIFKQGGAIFDVATCKLGCKPSYIEEITTIAIDSTKTISDSEETIYQSDIEEITTIAIDSTKTISDSEETIYQSDIEEITTVAIDSTKTISDSEETIYQSDIEEITTIAIDSTKTISDSEETIYQSESIPSKSEETTFTAIEPTKTISDSSETTFESKDLLPTSYDLYSGDEDYGEKLPDPLFSESSDEEPPRQLIDIPDYEDSYEEEDDILSLNSKNVGVRSVKVPLFNSAEPDSKDSDSYITLVVTHIINTNNSNSKQRYNFRVDYTDKRYEECVDKFTMEEIDYNAYCGRDCRYAPKFDLNTCKIVCDKFKNNDECLNDKNYYMKGAFPSITFPKPSITSSKVMIIDSNESSTLNINDNSYATIEKITRKGETYYYNVESNDDRVYSCNDNKNLKEIFPEKIDYTEYCGFGHGKTLYDVATCKLRCEFGTLEEYDSEEETITSSIVETKTDFSTIPLTKTESILTTETIATSDASSNASCAKKWEQCGGKTYTGVTCCESNLKCTKLNDWYYQCI